MKSGFSRRPFRSTRHDLGGCDVGPWEEISSGWYCRLLYPDIESIENFEPTVANVHTDPNGREVLRGGRGARELRAARRGQRRRPAWPTSGRSTPTTSSRQPVGRRLTDAEFRARLARGQEPPRPEWTRAFEPGPVPRGPGVP